MGGRSGRVRDRPPASVSRGDVGAARGHHRARAADRREANHRRSAVARSVATALPGQDYGAGEHRARLRGVSRIPGFGAERVTESAMLPPRLIRRLVLAPLAIVIALALAVLYPLLALLMAIFGLVTQRRLRRSRALRLLSFALVW